MISKPNAHLTPVVLNAKRDGVDVYATSDLMVPHPNRPGYWKVFGRSDDQIMHSTGEKVGLIDLRGRFIDYQRAIDESWAIR